jgi:sugar phosphate isomerase/epimerase
LKSKIALQLYSLREECNKNFINVLKKVSEFGYDGIEFYDFFNYDAKELMKIISNLNLKCAGSHTSFEKLSDNLDEVIRYNTILKSEFIVLPCVSINSKEQCLSICEFMNKTGEKLQKYGFKFLYHNHDFEFTQNYNGEMVEDIILKNTSAENVSLELDCYWASYANIDPISYLTNNIDRIKTIHLKDMDRNKKEMTEIGTGRIPCDKIKNICENKGLDWIILEQDDIYIDPFESIKISINNTRSF